MICPLCKKPVKDDVIGAWNKCYQCPECGEIIHKAMWLSFNDRCATATIRPDWKMPAPPLEKCPQCWSAPVAAVENTGDSWLAFWDCEEGCGYMPEDLIIDEWPFIEDAANDADFETAGFRVV